MCCWTVSMASSRLPPHCCMWWQWLAVISRWPWSRLTLKVLIRLGSEKVRCWDLVWNSNFWLANQGRVREREIWKAYPFCIKWIDLCHHSHTACIASLVTLWLKNDTFYVHFSSFWRVWPSAREVFCLTSPRCCSSERVRCTSLWSHAQPRSSQHQLQLLLLLPSKWKQKHYGTGKQQCYNHPFWAVYRVYANKTTSYKSSFNFNFHAIFW